jgi:nitrogen regulatory protein PII
MRLRKIEAIMAPAAFDLVKPVLEEMTIDIAVSEIHACGSEASRKGYYRGAEYRVLTPKIKLEIIVRAQDVSEVADAFSVLPQSEIDKVLLLDMGPATPLTIPCRDRS